CFQACPTRRAYCEVAATKSCPSRHENCQTTPSFRGGGIHIPSVRHSQDIPVSPVRFAPGLESRSSHRCRSCARLRGCTNRSLRRRPCTLLRPSRQITDLSLCLLKTASTDGGVDESPCGRATDE